MDKWPFYKKLPVLMAILCIPPIGATQIGWYFFGKVIGLNCGMVAGAISVSVAAYLLYIRGEILTTNNRFLFRKILKFSRNH